MGHYKVLKPFSLSRDGLTTEECVAGDLVEAPDQEMTGLLSEKYIEVSDVEEVATQVQQVQQIPDNTSISDEAEQSQGSPRTRPGRATAR